MKGLMKLWNNIVIQQNKIRKGRMLGCVNSNDHLDIRSPWGEEVKVRALSLMQDFNIAYLMLLSARSMFMSKSMQLYRKNETMHIPWNFLLRFVAWEVLQALS